MSTLRMRGCLCVALTALAIAVLPSSAPAGFGELDDVDYVGHVVGHPEATVQIDRIGRKVGVRATDVPMTCDDGSVQSSSFFPVYTRVRAKGRFAGQDYHIDGDATETYDEVGGRLRAGSATGYVFMLFDPSDNPGAPHRPDCSTLGQLRWTAERVP